MSRPISRKRAPGSSSAGDALARGHLAGAVLPLDAGRPAAFAQAGFQLLQLFDEQAHVRLARDVHVI